MRAHNILLEGEGGRFIVIEEMDLDKDLTGLLEVRGSPWLVAHGQRSLHDRWRVCESSVVRHKYPLLIVALTLCFTAEQKSSFDLLSPEERATLETWAHARSLPQRVVTAGADHSGGRPLEPAARRLRDGLGVSRPTVQLGDSALALRLPSLERTLLRPGRIPRIPASKIRAVVEATLHTATAPGRPIGAHAAMARAQGLSEASVRRIWKQHHLQPHRVKNLQAEPGSAICRENFTTS